MTSKIVGENDIIDELKNEILTLENDKQNLK